MERSKFIKRFVTFVTSLTKMSRVMIWRTLDLIALMLGSIISYVIFTDIIVMNNVHWALFILLTTITYNLVSHKLKLANRIARYHNMSDFIVLFVVQSVSIVLTGLLMSLILTNFSFRFVVVTALFSAIITAFYRIAWRGIYSYRIALYNKNEHTKNVLLIGAGDGGAMFIRNYNRNPKNLNIIGVLDNDSNKHGTSLGGVLVLGDESDLEKMVYDYDVDEIILTIPSLDSSDYERILQKANELDVPVYKMPPVEQVIQGKIQTNESNKVEISDLLGRQEITLDESQILDEIEGKVILITGAGGSIGSEIARQVAKYNPMQIILLGHGENSIYLIHRELLNDPDKSTQFIPVITDVQDYDAILKVFKQYQPDIVYHAAAHKHVPLMEVNPIEALNNNVWGSYNVARAVDAAGIPKMVMISTDKAVNPPNVMGATKRIAELLVIGMNQQSNSIFCAVRFGNVLGSRGSVIPVFEQQINEGGPITVTDFRMTRYFMTIPEASRLVIFAGAHAEGSEVFVLNMGEPVKILDLAKKMILLSGHNEHEIGIVESGIRPGEKLYEELLTREELVDKQLDDNIFIGQVIDQPIEETLAFVESLKQLSHNDMKKTVIQYANDSHKN